MFRVSRVVATIFQVHKREFVIFLLLLLYIKHEIKFFIYIPYHRDAFQQPNSSLRTVRLKSTQNVTLLHDLLVFFFSEIKSNVANRLQTPLYIYLFLIS